MYGACTSETGKYVLLFDFSTPMRVTWRVKNELLIQDKILDQCVLLKETRVGPDRTNRTQTADNTEERSGTHIALRDRKQNEWIG